MIEQKQIQLYVNHVINLDSNQQRKSFVKTSYQIPSPTILLPNELSSPIKSIPSSQTSISRITRSSPVDYHRKLVINQTPSFYLKTPEELSTNSERFIATSMSSVNLIRTISSEHTEISEEDQLTRSINRLSSTQLNLSIKPSTDLIQDSSEDLKAFPISPFEITPHRKNPPEMKQEYESLWKSKFTLKTLMSMAHRHDAQALKHRKPIDYHLFLTTKFDKNSLRQSDDRIFVSSQTHSLFEPFNNEQNRKFYARILSTMELRKPRKISSMIRNQRRQHHVHSLPFTEANPLPYFHQLTNENEKPFLTIYQAVPKRPKHQ